MAIPTKNPLPLGLVALSLLSIASATIFFEDRFDGIADRRSLLIFFFFVWNCILKCISNALGFLRTRSVVFSIWTAHGFVFILKRFVLCKFRNQYEVFFLFRNLLGSSSYHFSSVVMFVVLDLISWCLIVFCFVYFSSFVVVKCPDLWKVSVLVLIKFVIFEEGMLICSADLNLSIFNY